MASVLDSFRLDGRTALVTGASRGLGSAMTKALAEAGADVVLVSRSRNASLEKSLAALGRRVTSIAADVGEPAAAAEILRQARSAGFKPDILVNNAGIIRRAPFLEFSAADWNDVMDVNLGGAFRLSQAFAGALVADQARGSIINVASLLSFQGGIRVASYTAAKSALLGLTRLMANELAGRGIKVNALVPGYMVTDNTEALRADPVRSAEILGRIPAGRWGTPEDLKAAVVFLASPASDYMHGSTLAVDGGWLAR
jgi:2-deoxy-D-gluconate 3-dehydrogenase